MRISKYSTKAFHTLSNIEKLNHNKTIMAKFSLILLLGPKTGNQNSRSRGWAWVGTETVCWAYQGHPKIGKKTQGNHLSKWRRQEKPYQSYRYFRQTFIKGMKKYDWNFLIKISFFYTFDYKLHLFGCKPLFLIYEYWRSSKFELKTKIIFMRF